MEGTWIVVVLLCLASGITCLEEEKSFMQYATEVFAESLPGYLEMLIHGDLHVPQWSAENSEKLTAEVGDLLGRTLDACSDCRVILAALMSIVRAGNSYEDLKDLLMSICYVVVPPYDPQLLCEGALDNYAPHAIRILNETTQRPVDICYQMNSCFANHDSNIKSVKVGDSWNGQPLPKQSENPPPDRRDTLRVLHLTDIHVDEFYALGFAGRYGSYPCNIPYETLDKYFNFLKLLNPDLILYTGDSPPHTVWLETQSGQLNVSEQVTQYFHKHFPGIPAFTAIGNHEMYPTNLYYVKRPEIRELNVELAKYWTELSGFEEEQIRTHMSAGYYSILVKPGLRVMSWNSNYGATDNFYNILNGEDAEEYQAMIAYFRSELTSARDNGEKVMVISHHTTGGGGSINYNAYAITNLLAEFGDIIVFYLLGHDHGDDFAIIPDWETHEPKVVAFSGASFTTYTNKNPSAKLFLLDPKTFLPLDAIAYAIDITENEDGDVLIAREVYRYSTEYGLTDLSPQSFRALVDRLAEEPNLMWRYRYNQNTRFRDPGNCNEGCIINLTCDMLNPVYEMRRDCRSQLLAHKNH